jgi:GTP-binding protein HflX
VGFLGRLPHHLVASFHATLEEALNADLLLHVVDASHPDAPDQMAAVDEVLGGLAHSSRTGVLVMNKIDLLRDPLDLQLLVRGRRERVVYVSAYTGEGLDRLDALVRESLDARSALLDLKLPLWNGKLAAQVRASAVVLEEEVVGDQTLRLRVRMDEGALGNLKRSAGGELSYDELEPAREPLLSEEP